MKCGYIVGKEGVGFWLDPGIPDHEKKLMLANDRRQDRFYLRGRRFRRYEELKLLRIWNDPVRLSQPFPSGRQIESR